MVGKWMGWFAAMLFVTSAVGCVGASDDGADTTTGAIRGTPEQGKANEQAEENEKLMAGIPYAYAKADVKDLDEVHLDWSLPHYRPTVATLMADGVWDTAGAGTALKVYSWTTDPTRPMEALVLIQGSRGAEKYFIYVLSDGLRGRCSLESKDGALTDCISY